MNNKSKEIDESQQTETDTIEISNSIKNIKPEEKLKEEQKEDILSIFNLIIINVLIL